MDTFYINEFELYAYNILNKKYLIFSSYSNDYKSYNNLEYRIYYIFL